MLYSGVALCLSYGLWLFGCSAVEQRVERPNIVFVLIDTLRADHLTSYGYQKDTAVNIQKLAEQGVLFERVIAPSSWTKTSMASIMTSRNATRHGVVSVTDVIPHALVTLAEGLDAEGYHTIGVNSNPWMNSRFGFSAGFDHYETFPIINKYFFGDAEKINRKALKLLDATPDDGDPFFLYLHYMDVHSPYLPKSRFFSAPELSIPEIGPVPDFELEYLYRIENLEAPGVVERMIDLYDGEIRTVDAAIGGLLKNLKESGRLENTIVVITSDHGEEFREHGNVEHGWNLYPEVYEVPLIISWSGHLPAGIRITSQVRSIDIAPTLFAMADLPVPESFEGEPLLPMTSHALPDRIAKSFVGFNPRLPKLDYAAIVSPRYLYVRERVNNTVEFYDLQSDPGAKNNLGASHAEAASYAKLESEATIRTDEQTALDEETRRQLKALGYLQ